jgi:hypothetical protein
VRVIAREASREAGEPERDEQPYLSVVATARNDDHGGNPLGRLQTFINHLVAQAARHNVSVELVLVDWNPPAGKPKLAGALRAPAELGPCTLRIIEVSPELHARYNHADNLPLFQMIAKNAGIRRARGRFILATNIDVLFSEEFFEFLRGRALQPGRMYRLDRLDVASEVPVDASVEERLEFCNSHLLRINAREGTFAVTPGGLRTPAQEDISEAGCGIVLGRGWYEPSQYFGHLFRWVSNDAELILKPPSDEARVLALELEPGPGVGNGPLQLQILNEAGETLGENLISGRTFVRISCAFPAAVTRVLRLRVMNGGRFVSNDPRVMNFRVFRCAWGDSGTSSQAVLVTPSEGAAHPGILGRATGFRAFARRGLRFLAQLRKATGPVRIGFPISPKTLERFQVQLDASGLSFVVNPPAIQTGHTPCLGQSEPPRKEPRPREAVHTNACGDFTLLSREDWFDLRGYPEFDIFSLHIDSVFCYAACAAGLVEETLQDPIRMYHIEHETGSGWTPEGQEKLVARLKASGLPWLDYYQVVTWAEQMRQLRAPMIFNRANWGLADFNLPETRLPGGRHLASGF